MTRESVVDSRGSAAGAGETKVNLGAGLFQVDLLSVSPSLTTDPTQSVYVVFTITRADGSFISLHLGAGYFNVTDPFVLETPKVIEGPGVLSVVVVPSAITSRYNFNYSYRRIHA